MWGWNGGWGWHAGTVLFPFVMLLALVGTVALILWLVRWTNQGAYHPHGCPYSRHPWPQPGRGALDILEERLARGEIRQGGVRREAQAHRALNQVLTPAA